MKGYRARVAWALVGASAYLGVTFLSRGLVGRTPEGRHPLPEPGAGDYVQSVPRDGILPVYDPTFLPAARAALDPAELVMGVEMRGQARAYPVGFLNFREMVNDRIGPIPFLVTW